MGQLFTMSRNTRVAGLLFVLSLCVAALCQAANAPKDDIVYYTNLGRADDVKLLLKQGASPNQANESGVPLLALASARKDSEALPVLKVLVAAGADINAKDSLGQTALFYAAREDNIANLKYLLSKGINYYSADRAGNIARTIAFQAGHKDIVEALDSFVQQQTSDVQKQYEDYIKKLQQRYEGQQAASPPAPPQAVVPPNAPKNANRVEDTMPLFSDLSFNSCAFQYWYYVSAVKQSNELSPEDLSAVIDSYKQKIADLEQRLLKDYHIPHPSVKNVLESAKQRVFNQLGSMVSNSDRHEYGVGKMDDMQARCSAIARQWNTPPPGIHIASHSGAYSGGGGIGGVGTGGGTQAASAKAGNAPKKNKPGAITPPTH